MEEVRKDKKKTVVVLAGVTGLVSLAAIIFVREPLIERWHLWRLDSSDRETRLEAMGALVRMRSPTAVSRFLEIACSDTDVDVALGAMGALLTYGCETWVEGFRGVVLGTGMSEAEFVRRFFESYVIMLRELTGKEVRSPVTLEEACEIMVKFTDLVSARR